MPAQIKESHYASTPPPNVYIECEDMNVYMCDASSKCDVYTMRVALTTQIWHNISGCGCLRIAWSIVNIVSRLVISHRIYYSVSYTYKSNEGLERTVSCLRPEGRLMRWGFGWPELKHIRNYCLHYGTISFDLFNVYG